MDSKIEQAKNKLREDPMGGWSFPLIESLEEKSRHLAMFWMFDVLEITIDTSNHELSKDWLNWLRPLKESLEGAKTYSSEDFRSMSNKVFQARDKHRLQSAIFQIYAAEVFYQEDEYERYQRKIAFIMGAMNDFKSSMTPIVTTAFATYEKYMGSI